MAFASDATRTLQIFAQGDVIDIINPTVAKTKEEFVKDQTVIYELRVNPETKIELFRRDPSNIPETYANSCMLLSIIDRSSISEVLLAKPAVKNSVNIAAFIKQVSPLVSYQGMQNTLLYPSYPFHIR